MNRCFKHIETGKVYIVPGLDNNGSNAREAEQYVIYKDQESDEIFISKWQEFLENFKEIQ